MKFLKNTLAIAFLCMASGTAHSIERCRHWNLDPQQEVVCSVDIIELVSEPPKIIKTGSMVSIFGVLGFIDGQGYLFLDQLRRNSLQMVSAIKISDENFNKKSSLDDAPRVTIITSRIREVEGGYGLNRWELYDVRIALHLVNGGGMRQIYSKKN